MKLTENIIRESKIFEKEYSKILAKIKSAKRIAIFRHIMPDFDALGTQFGLATRIKDNFPEKEVRCFGDNHVTFTPRGLFPETNKLSDAWFDDEFLAIIVDVGDQKRIADPRFIKAKYKIKIDHHPMTDDIFDLSVVDTEKAAAAEIVVNMLLSFKGKYVFSKKAAEYFYIALVGDSGRFQYSSTTPHTFDIASLLLEKGINITEIYEKMYIKTLDDLEVTKFIMNNFKIDKYGVAYYVLTNNDLINLKITSERGKDNVNLFSNIEGVKIWCSITEDITEPCFRVSIRSRNYVINGVAAEFKGGGHAQASGAQIADLSELPKLIEALDRLIIENK
ncbi:MAG: bifunctional oligoribonuclease/PAP phosphatase NrnA [Bacilli bacterium]|nr:bifunctional oligoribonuclease/PAP phosphatase NrnA [Bacilli bacterium]